MALHLLELPQPHSASLPNITPFQLSVANKTFLAVLPDLAVLAVLSAVVRLARIAALSFVRRFVCGSHGPCAVASRSAAVQMLLINIVHHGGGQ